MGHHTDAGILERHEVTLEVGKLRLSFTPVDLLKRGNYLCDCPRIISPVPTRIARRRTLGTVRSAPAPLTTTRATDGRSTADVRDTKRGPEVTRWRVPHIAGKDRRA